MQVTYKTTRLTQIMKGESTTQLGVQIDNYRYLKFDLYCIKLANKIKSALFMLLSAWELDTRGAVVTSSVTNHCTPGSNPGRGF